MKISGFTVIRNAGLMGYPITQSIQSILPIVDEFIIGVGQSDDNTIEMIKSIKSDKIKMFDSFWDTKKTSGGLVLSEKTNEALAKCTGDWCFYLQADEVINETDLKSIYSSCEKHLNDPRVEGLLFKYIHFYGSYSVVATARNWYRNEVRIVRNKIGAKSVGDAQGFRIASEKGESERKPKVKPANGSVYHYGWVKPPQKMGEKNKHMNRWWHGNKFDKAFDNFSYQNNYGLKTFRGRHPALMRELVSQQNWTFEPGFRPLDWNLKDYKNFFSDVTEKIFRHRFGEHKNYVLIK